MPICVKCEYVNKFSGSSRCINPDLPMTDFVTGYRDCHVLNPKGECKGFKAQPSHESIYETKEDEELARTSKDNDHI